jgi:hypothetical protein
LRLILRAAAFLSLIVSLAVARPTAANAQAMLPEQSAAKARQVLQQVVGALGGQAYLNARDTDCHGRVAQFGSNDDLMGYTLFRDMWSLPDKNRTEFISKGEHTILGFLLDIDGLIITHGGVLVTVFNGSQGWMLDKSGVSNQPEGLVKNFMEQLKSGMNNMLRFRMNEPGVQVQYGGTDIIDLKEAEWIEFTDNERRNLRLAVDKFTHLPMRWVITARDPDTREITEAITTYAQYLAMDGVKTPMNIVRLRNDHRLTQTFLAGCKYNSELDTQLFTRESLAQHAGDIAKKGYKNTQDKN